MVFDGDAHLAPCPCPRPPLTLAASAGRFEAPGDLVLRSPRVELFGRPVLALPWLWIRAPERVGLLPPLLALRGADGLLVGSGVHLPWSAGERALDLGVGAFTAGGVELSATLISPGSRARVVVDEVRGTRAALEARGASAAGRAALAWDLDAVRGDRAGSGTVELAAAARPFDTGAAEASLRVPAGAVQIVAAAGLAARAERGEGPIAAGPRASVSVAGPIGRAGSWSAGGSAVMLGDGADRGALPLAQADAAAQIDARPGPVELRGSTGARAAFAGPAAATASPSQEVAAAARLEVALPFARTFAGALTHWIVPTIAVRGAVADVRGELFAPIGGAPPPAAWMTSAGISTALGRYAGPSIRLDARAGAAGDAVTLARGLFHARFGVDARLAAAALEAAAVGDGVGRAASDRAWALLARSRLGAEDGPFVRVDAAAQGSRAPFGAGAARAVAAGAWAWLPGDPLAYFADGGITAGAELSVPWAAVARASARADVDLATGTLLAVRGAAEVRHPCGCLSVGLAGAHRLGREGVDVSLTFALFTPRRRR